MQGRKRDRRYYLSDIPLEEAWARFDEALAGVVPTAAAETVSIDAALGRVTAAPVWAKASSPHYDSAAMDGIAVRAADTVGATETAPVRLKLAEQAVWVDTGDPMPPGFNAVVMVEVVHEVDDSVVEVQSAVAPYQHVRPLGEDIVATELLLPVNHRLRPADLGACAAAGVTEVAVRARPRVAVIPTGSELVPAGVDPKPGEIVEFNGLVLAGMVSEWGAEPVRRDPVPDDYDRLKEALSDAVAGSDIVVMNAGSSAGSEDYTARLVEELGTLAVHGVAIRPGHPVVLGVIGGKPVLGIPGYPVSAVITCELFVKPLIERALGVPSPARPKVAATITRKVTSPMGEDEFLRVRLGRVGPRLVATPVQRGAGVISSLVRADGMARVPRFSEGLDAGQEIEVELLRPPEDIESTIVATGSHDLVLDLLASRLRALRSDRTLSSANVGSLGGLMALARGEAHLAGSHLLDEDTGEYNISYIERYLKGRDVVVLGLVDRVQGLMVPAGNPKGIGSLEDLVRDDVIFINRQRGSGTRVLLDFKLKEAGLSTEAVTGYDREEYTHLGVAASVASGGADAGLGILSAARAMGLDFVPLMTEQYDLVMLREHYLSELMAPLLSLVRDEAFAREVESLGGYDVSGMGRVVAEMTGQPG